MSTDILGRGFSYPLQTSVRGGIMESQHTRKVRESILIILGTQLGERVMRPDFGCDLRSLVFAPNNTATANLARHYVEQALRTWEPRIVLDTIQVDNDPGEDRLLIHLAYRIKSTYEPQNLVYPFYLQPE